MRLTANLTLLLLLNAALLISSCQKELDSLDPGSGTGTPPGSVPGIPPGSGTGNTRNIEGEYYFVGLTAYTYSSVVVSDQGSQLRSVTVSNYVTKNNVGTATINATDINFIRVGYNIDTTANGKTYVDGDLLSDFDFPYIASFPPKNTTNSYTRVNDDSLNITGALGVSDPSGVTPTGSAGVKLSWSGDTLMLRIKSSFTQNITQGGVDGILTGNVDGFSKLKKR